MAENARVNDLFLWQIGSQGPPATCLCCGRRFDQENRRIRGPYLTSPYIYVCQECWALPFVFYPDKIEMMRADGYLLPERSSTKRR
ncbi:MAG: hypothetical protein L3K14_01530 [Thermoplasmata archaeon]|nr:hypothetical protein [Thermoplasmata archaeon]